eukprot:gnl/MRDRNA2_/MRDRNA2_152798_c0_seq1.p2 gnl/MRDRNA2_/MRDRNA2_152798_c0~~gnl/MRDRNA2_/MRDRNA2_152798_c0_seq1.p2  ORF type:complete len:109 (-),score=27.45 gnl/MRDRNA2_/MRDRNA2_152798_c0_seq1:31-357(-)
MGILSGYSSKCKGKGKGGMCQCKVKHLGAKAKAPWHASTSEGQGDEPEELKALLAQLCEPEIEETNGPPSHIEEQRGKSGSSSHTQASSEERQSRAALQSREQATNAS